MLFLSLTFVKSIVAEEFIFDTPEILILDDGNLLKSEKGGVITTDDESIIYADKFEYNKISSILTATGNVVIIDKANNTETKSETLIYSKNQEIITAEGNVNIIDNKMNITLSADKTIYSKKEDIFRVYDNAKIVDRSKDITIETNKMIYDRKKEKISSLNKTNIYLKNDVSIKTSDIVYLGRQNKIFSDKLTEMTDKDNYFYRTDNFRYFLNTKTFRGKNLYILTDEKDKYYFSDGTIDLVSKEIAGKDLVTYFNTKFSDDRNEPRLKGNAGYSDSKQTKISKGAFTTCKSRGDKCPPWVIEADKVIHDKQKKIVYYSNAWLKVYDIPVFYYPKFFHPDPTVERQTGFLKPSISSSTNLGSSIYLPYFYVLSESQDLTFKPRFYEDDKTILQTEYRSKTKNSYTIIDGSYTSGHKSYKEDDKDSRGHLFAKSIINLESKFYDSSQININIENTTNDTYLKLFRLESPLLYEKDFNTLESDITFTAEKKDLDIQASVSIYEKLNLGSSDKYEFILPEFILNKNIEPDNYPGFLNFNSSGSSRLFETNKSETKLVNDLVYFSESSIFNNGIKSDYNLMLKNFNAFGNNSSNFESSLNTKFLTKYIHRTSYPLVKRSKYYNDYLSPKISFRYSPNGMSKEINHGIDIGNIFANNRIGTSDTFESGKSLTFGVDYSKENNTNNNKILNVELGTIYRFKEEMYLGSDNSMNKKNTDLVGKLEISPIDGNFVKYNFALNNDLNTFNSHSITGQITINNFVTKWDYIEDLLSNSKNHSLKNETRYKFNDSKSFGFSTSVNKKIDFTEFYKTFYEYQNDCLTARIEYNKSYYEDKDIKPSENLFFSLTVIPLGAYQSQNMLKGF